MTQSDARPILESLRTVQQRFEKINNSPGYKDLVARSEFQMTRELLREYIEVAGASGPILKLAPPPEE